MFDFLLQFLHVIGRFFKTRVGHPTSAWTPVWAPVAVVHRAGECGSRGTRKTPLDTQFCTVGKTPFLSFSAGADVRAARRFADG